MSSAPALPAAATPALAADPIPHRAERSEGAPLRRGSFASTYERQRSRASAPSAEMPHWRSRKHTGAGNLARQRADVGGSTSRPSLRAPTTSSQAPVTE